MPTEIESAIVTHDFGDGAGPVAAHTHANGGGWVADTAMVVSTAYVGPYAQVYGSARVYGSAEVSSLAHVYGSAELSGDAHVSGTARVYGIACVGGAARVHGNARVCGEARVGGNAQVCGDAHIAEHVRITGDTVVTENGPEEEEEEEEGTPCARCGDRSENICENCCRGYGEACDCCTCSICADCGNRVRHLTCDECNHCSDCGCNCEPDEESVAAPSNAGKPFEHRNARLVGIEVEYNSVRSREYLDDFCEKWRAGDHEDGSCGREIVTAPIAGPYIAKCLDALGDAFERAVTKADHTCGIHVHVDARDLTWHDMYRLLWVYSKVEPLLYVLAGQHRVANHYCQPAGERYSNALRGIDRKGEILGVAYGERTPRDAVSAKALVRAQKPGKKGYDGGRYKGLNICPWLAGRRENPHPEYERVRTTDEQFRAMGTPNYGRAYVIKANGEYLRRPVPGTAPAVKPIKKDSTVEFRLHRNTLDMQRVAQWATLCERIVSWVAKASDAETQALPQSTLSMLCAIAPESKTWILERVATWKHATRRKSGVPRRVQVRPGGVWTITDKTTGKDE